MARLLSSIETGLTWLERTPWGQKVIAAVIAAAISGWAYVSARYPPPVILIVFVFLVWALLDIEARIIRGLVERLAPPFSIEARHMVIGNGSGTAPSQRAVRWVTSYFYALNRSKTRRMSMVISVMFRPSNGGAHSLDSGMVELVGVTPNLGPEEETSGSLRFPVPDNQMDVESFDTRIELIVKDRISGRTATFRIPGVYPDTKP